MGDMYFIEVRNINSETDCFKRVKLIKFFLSKQQGIDIDFQFCKGNGMGTMLI